MANNQNQKNRDDVTTNNQKNTQQNTQQKNTQQNMQQDGNNQRTAGGGDQEKLQRKDAPRNEGRDSNR